MDSKIFYFFCFLFLKGKHIGVTKEGTNFVLLHIKNRLQIWKVLPIFHIVVYCKIILPESYKKILQRNCLVFASIKSPSETKLAIY